MSFLFLICSHREICVKTFLELRRHHREIVLLLEMLQLGNEHLPIFIGKSQKIVNDLRARFRLDLDTREVKEFVHTLIESATGNIVNLDVVWRSLSYYI